MATALLFSAVLTATPAAAAAKGKPGGTQILPVDLGSVTGCTYSYGWRLSPGGFNELTVVGGAWGCAGGGGVPISWSYGLGMQAIGTDARPAHASGVSNDGTITIAPNEPGQAYVLAPGAVSPTLLTPLQGMNYARADGISLNSDYIVGTSIDSGGSRATAWTVSGSGWSPGRLGPSTSYPDVWVPAVTDTGTAIINLAYRDAAGRVVQEAATAQVGFDGMTVLPGDNVRARDIDAAGSRIVGYRQGSCVDCPEQSVPVYWTRQQDVWGGPYPLALGGGIGARANGVAIRDGRMLIVGESYSKRFLTRALAWVEQGDGSFKVVQLAPIAGKSSRYAFATDVNELGFVTGGSQSGMNTGNAVVWELPK
jgi:hypothetical protein